MSRQASEYRTVSAPHPTSVLMGPSPSGSLPGALLEKYSSKFSIRTTLTLYP